MRAPWIVAFAVSLSVAALAQTSQPYAGLQDRPIKTLSKDRIDDLRAGRGLGYALAAELNGYPGPLHVLELRSRLDLTADQHQRVETLFKQMRDEAVPLGERLIEQETTLDALFSSRTITPDLLSTTTQEIGVTEAALRATHLKFHLSTLAILTPTQARRYVELRGYTSTQPGQHHQRRH
jgi:Spy/CpxP family protein refolding chaperone